MKKKILGLMMAVAVVCTSSNYVMAAQDVGNINFHLNPHGNADETGSVTKKTYSSGVNYYLKMKTEDAANNSVDISGYWRP